MRFCVLGAGAWGTGIAIHIARRGHQVVLVPRRVEQARKLAKERENRRYLKGCRIPEEIWITSDLAEGIEGSEIVLMACPSKGLRDSCWNLREMGNAIRNVEIVLSLCKGIELETDLLSAEVISDVLPGTRVGVLSGPTYAKEVAIGQPSAVVFAVSKHDAYSLSIQEAMSDRSLRVYTNEDLRGVELGACLKNVYAIAAGICDGLGFGDNAKSALLTRSLGEMVRLGVALGGQLSTFYGLSGFGDLAATCNGEWSRNRTFGRMIAEGECLESLLSKKNMTVEGYHSTHCFYSICKDKNLESPILDEVFGVLYQGKDVREVLQSLMGRSLKPEKHDPDDFQNH